MSHSLTSNIKKSQEPQRQIEITEPEMAEAERTEIQTTRRRSSIDYERTGLADQIIALPLEIQKGKYQSPQTRQCIIDDDIKWQEFEYQKKVSFDYYSKQTPFNYNEFYEDIISIVQIVFGKDRHNGLIKKTIVEKTILELLQQKENFIMTQSQLHRLQTDIQEHYERLKTKNMFRKVFNTLHKVLQVASTEISTTKGAFRICLK